jgi:hypothetical protein
LGYHSYRVIFFKSVAPDNSDSGELGTVTDSVYCTVVDHNIWKVRHCGID